MKTKAQKSQALTEGAKLMAESKSFLFTDFSGMPANEINMLRKKVKSSGGRLLVIKKRLLAIAAKQNGVEVDLKPYKFSVATIFAEGSIDTIAGSVFSFFKEKKTEQEKMLIGYDMTTKSVVAHDQLIAIGALPPREVLLGQLVGTIAAPIRAFLYLLDQKSKKV